MGRTNAQILECPLDRLSGLVVKSAGIRLGSNLNSGGWGTVYLGRLTAPAQSSTRLDPSPESKIKRLVHRSLFRQPARLFAVKVLQTAHSGRDKEMQDEEARLHLLASSSHHPGIVKLHQVIKEPKFTFLVLVRRGSED
jgi:serine/threonine protein kinase